MTASPNVEESSSPSPAPRGRSIDSPALATVEGLLKFLAAFAGLITLLGTPAVTVQFIRFHIPLEFMARNQALRAGIMPAICLTLLGISIHWALTNPTRLLERLNTIGYGGVVAARVGISGVTVTDTSLWLTATTVIALLLTPVAAVWNYSLHRIFDHLPAAIRGGETWGSLQRTVWVAAVLFTAFVFYAIFRNMGPKLVARSMVFALLARFVRWMIGYFHVLANRLGHPLFQGAVFALILSFLFSAYLVSQKLVYGGQQWLRAGFWGALVEGFGYGCLVAFIAVLGGALTQQADPSTKKRGQAMAYGAIFIIYFPFVAFYASQWYPQIPYAFGGGKPTQVSIWLERKNVPESVQQIFGCAKEGELLRCEKAHLLDHDSDRTILVNSNDAHTSSCSMSFSKETVKAMSGARARF